jgi:hypothetical protein
MIVKLRYKRLQVPKIRNSDLWRHVPLEENFIKFQYSTSLQRRQHILYNDNFPLDCPTNTFRDLYLSHAFYILLHWITLTHDRPDLSSERAPQKDKTVTSKKKSLVKCPRFGLDTKTYWLTDRQSQCDFDFDFDFDFNYLNNCWRRIIIYKALFNDLLLACTNSLPLGSNYSCQHLPLVP